MTPKCETCINRDDCSLLKELSEARETIFNYGREKAGRTDFIYKGRVVPAEEGKADATREELFAAVRLIIKNCKEQLIHDCDKCVLYDYCFDGMPFFGRAPGYWPDPEEGGGKNG